MLGGREIGGGLLETVTAVGAASGEAGSASVGSAVEGSVSAESGDVSAGMVGDRTGVEAVAAVVVVGLLSFTAMAVASAVVGIINSWPIRIKSSLGRPLAATRASTVVSNSRAMPNIVSYALTI